MTNLMKIEQNLTMSTREIAELTCKEHRNVLVDTRKMLEELHGEEGMLTFQQTKVESVPVVVSNLNLETKTQHQM